MNVARASGDAGRKKYSSSRMSRTSAWRGNAASVSGSPLVSTLVPKPSVPGQGPRMRYRSATMPEPKLTTAIKARTETTKRTVQTERDRTPACTWSASGDGSMDAKTQIGDWRPGQNHDQAHD